MIHFIEIHGFESLIVYFAFNAMISGMPAPDTTSSRGYQWLYASLHTFGGSLDKVVASRTSQLVDPPKPSAS